MKQKTKALDLCIPGNLLLSFTIFNQINRMTENEAKKTGVKVIIIGIMIGLLVAILIMAWLDGGLGGFGDFLKRLLSNFFVALISLFYFGYLFGKKAGIDIIIKKRNAYWISLKTSFLTLMLGTFFGSLVGFFVEGLMNESFADAAFNYIVKPFYWVLFFGVPFLLIISGLLGWQIKRNGKDKSEEIIP